jgi:hypothetical protein
MNRPPDVELVLRSYLADTGDRAPDRVLEDVAARIARQPRRRTWRLSRRPYMNTYAKLGIAAAAIVMVAVAGYSILPRTGVGPGSPTAAPTAAPTPSATAAAVVPSPTPGSGLLPSGRLAAGHYTIAEIPDFSGLEVAADVPAGWVGYPEIPALVSPTRGSADGALIGFMKADGLFSDPCHWDVDGSGAENQPGDVEVGPTVDDLVTAIRANTAYTSSTPSPVSLGGYDGAVIELRLPGQDVLDTCDVSATDPGDGKYLLFPNGFWAQGPNNIWRLFIVDVDGRRLITMLNYFDDVPTADVDAAVAIIESFVITP